jgi:GNAT superfamily N-acetyltransferase
MSKLVQEVATGIAGVLIVSLLAFFASAIHNFYIRRKYPVGGKYVTRFEDTVDRQRLTQTSISRLKQRGRRLSGKTTQRSGRTWLLDGSIMGKGHISGVYSAEGLDDEGVGAFYLRIHGDVLDGLWSGYDHVNKTTTSGRYIFKRLVEVNILPLRNSNVAAVLAIAEKVFGPDYLSGADLSDASSREVFVALNNRQLVGFAAVEAGGVSTTLKEPIRVPRDVLHGEKSGTLGIIRTIAVAEYLQGHGIGEQLFLAMERDLKRRGKTLIAVPAWEDNNGIHLNGIISGNGYERFLTCKQYWKDACDSGVFSCRGRDPRNGCLCNLIWYKKAFT